ncbi:MAG TPA: HEAT repeat domain-containing protein [Anaerolineales bacterium]|nr:HEAT repeat domain-containing protein [Anaerolineales bacterium]
MDTQQNPFHAVLDSLLDEKKEFPRRHLQLFSDLGALELKSVMDVWPRLSPSRKLFLLKGLETLAEGDTLVSFDDFAKALLNDPDSTVRGRAIRLLSECEDPNLIPTFIDIMKFDFDAQTRAEAATVLSLFVDLGELEEIPEDLFHEVEDALLAVANGMDESRVRRRALESLGYSSRTEVQTLIDSAYRREDPAWKASALFAMGRSADTRWDDEILQSLISENETVQEAAVAAAGQLSIKAANPILLNLLTDAEQGEVDNAVIWSLSQVGGEDVRTYLENLLDLTEDEEQIEFLEEALENLSFTEDLDRFELMALDPEFLDDLEEVDEEE